MSATVISAGVWARRVASRQHMTPMQRYEAFREDIAPEQRPAFDAAVTGCAQILADARAALALAYDEGGAMAVADLCYVPGGPSREELAARYEKRLREPEPAEQAA
jgi:hypothetical protein